MGLEGMVLRDLRIVVPRGTVRGSIAIRDGRIAKVIPEGEPLPRLGQLVDGGGAYALPGFIDLHCHGGGGGNVMDGSADALDTVARTHAEFGTTGFLPTTVTASHEETLAVVSGVAAWMDSGAAPDGAQPLGIHLEGPYLNPDRAGVQDAAVMRDPDLDELQQLWQASGERVRQVTLAPERPGALEAIRWLAARGIVVGAAHSTASYEQMVAAQEAGLSHVVHLYNAQLGLHHRRPGVVGAALTLEGLTCELIADGVHVHPAAVRLAVRARGWSDMILITDAMEAVARPEGRYRLGRMQVTVKGGEARLADGTLAGSVLTLNRAVANMVSWTGCGLPEAAAMASLNAARRLGLAERKGSIAPGKDADIVICGPTSTRLDVYLTVRQGRIIYHDHDAPTAITQH